MVAAPVYVPTNSNKRFLREEYISTNTVIMAYMWWLLKANWPCFLSLPVPWQLLSRESVCHCWEKPFLIIILKKVQRSDSERVTGRKARGLQTEETGCKGQTFFISPLIGRRKQTTSVRYFFLLHTKLKGGFSTEMFFLSYVSETMYLLWNLPFFKMVPPKTNIFSFLKPWVNNNSTNQYSY